MKSKNTIKENYFEDNKKEFLKLLKLTEKYNESKELMLDKIMDIRKKARQDKRLDIVDALIKVTDSTGVPFKFENSLMELEALLKNEIKTESKIMYESRFKKQESKKVKIKENQIYYWLGISTQNKDSEMMLLGCSTETYADKAKEYLENVSDVSIFAVDYYGKANLITVQNYFDKYVLAGVLYYRGRNLKTLVKTMYNMLTR